MQLGIVGLGRMGGNIARRLMRNGHQVVVSDRNQAAIDTLVNEGAKGASDLAALVGQLGKPRAVWVMLPAGEATEQTIAQLADLLEAGDAVIDGGNTFYKDDILRAAELGTRGLHYVDVGTSGGVWGLERGYCMMIGGEQAVVEHLDPLFAPAWRRGLAASPEPVGARAISAVPSKATSTLGRPARGISSRWSTTASSTA